jgi:hypothetical protein
MTAVIMVTTTLIFPIANHPEANLIKMGTVRVVDKSGPYGNVGLVEDGERVCKKMFQPTVLVCVWE